MRLWLAWGVHLYTASSALIAVWGLVATFDHEFRLAIYLMMLSMVIDSTDGALARLVDVKSQIPWFDGRRLDDICDYTSYVILPACFMIEAQLLPHPAWASLIVLASAYGFSRDDAKTPDHFFTGFPSYFNVVAIYLYLLEIQPGTGLFITAVLAIAVFVPIRYLYPSRTRVLRPLTLTVVGAWVLAITWLGVRPEPDPFWVRLTLLGPAYYLGLSFLLNLQPRLRGG